MTARTAEIVHLQDVTADGRRVVGYRIHAGGVTDLLERDRRPAAGAQ